MPRETMMEILNLSHNDDQFAMVRKCNTNFRQLAWAANKLVRDQGIMDASSLNTAIQGLQDQIDALTNTTIPAEVTAQLAAADIPGQVSDALDQALDVTVTTTLSDFFTEDACTVTACNAMRWGSMAFIRFSYRLNSALTVPSNGDITDVTLGKLKVGWRPFDMTNVILDQTRILIGDVDSNGDVKARSANSRGTSYTIDANAVLYASMMLMLGLQ